MSVNSSNYSSSSGLSNMDRSAIGNLAGKFVDTDEASNSFSVDMASDQSSIILTANDSDKRSILATCAKAGIVLKDGVLTLDAMDRLADYAANNKLTEPWVGAMSRGVGAMAEHFKQANPVAYAKALNHFTAQRKSEHMGIFDLLLYLGAKGVESSIAMIQSGANIKSQSMRVTVKASAASAQEYKDQSKKTIDGGIAKFNAEAAAAGLSLFVSIGATGAGLKGAKHSSTHAEAENRLNLSKIDMQEGQGAAAMQANQEALTHFQAVSKKTAFLKVGGDSGMPLSNGITSGAGAAGTKAETSIQVAGTDAQGNINDNQAKSAEAEAAKSSGEQSASQGAETARSILSSILSALSAIAQSLSKAAGAA